jgi:hypothetical protein
MADLSITAASVLAGSGATTARGTAGATITAGQLLYLDSSDNELKLADSNDTAAKATVVGVALHASLDGQPLAYLTSGNITIGATVSLGKVYVLSTTAGGIAPIDDIASTEYISVLGVATTTAIITVNIQNSGVAAAAAVT